MNELTSDPTNLLNEVTSNAPDWIILNISVFESLISVDKRFSEEMWSFVVCLVVVDCSTWFNRSLSQVVTIHF